MNDRFATPAFKATAARERLDELLMLPQLSRDEIQRLATLTATAFSTALERACDEVIEKTGRGDDDLFTRVTDLPATGTHGVKTGYHATLLAVAGNQARPPHRPRPGTGAGCGHAPFLCDMVEQSVKTPPGHLA